jgi:hypothetical protein
MLVANIELDTRIGRWHHELLHLCFGAAYRRQAKDHDQQGSEIAQTTRGDR